MRLWVCLAGLAFALCNLGHAADLALVGAKIYPSPADAVIENGAIVVHDGSIRAVGPRARVKIPRGAEVIDGTGLTVTAGFWNSHVHILPPGLLHARDARAGELNPILDAMFNRWGFTTVFDVASVLDNTLALRRRIERGEVRGPHILTVGEPVWTIEPSYVREFLRVNQIHIPNTETPEQAIALVRDHVAKGADGIKLFTGSAQRNGTVVMPLAIAHAAVDEAHRHHMPVFAHPNSLDGLNVAVESGVDILAHTVADSPAWDHDLVTKLKQRNMALIPTLTLFDVELRKDDASDQDREAVIARVVAELKAYAQAGGEILFGTDIGYIDHFDTTMEFTLMARAGMDYRQILASLTTNPARRFGNSKTTGRIAEGMNADLVVLGGDPAQDVTAFSKVRYTIRNGKIISPEVTGR